MSEIIEDLKNFNNWNELHNWEKKITLHALFFIIYISITFIYGTYYTIVFNPSCLKDSIKLLNDFIPLIFSRLILEWFIVWRYG